MRITHLTDAYLPRLGGIETQVARLATYQASHGRAVEVLTTTPAHRGDHGPSTQRHDGVTIRRLAARLPGGIPVHPRAAHYLAAHLTAQTPDVVHLHMGVATPSAQSCLPTLVRLKIPTVVTVHSVWGSARHLFAALNQVIHWSRWPIVWSGVSDLAARPLRELVGISGPVLVIPNGIEMADWVNPTTRHRATAPLHIVTATRFAPRKRVLPLIDILAHVVRVVGPDAVTVTIAGAGGQADAMRQRISRHGLGESIHLPGRLTATELRKLYATADVFAAPAIDESFGIAALEAQAAGLTVVTRAESGVAERITHRRNGLIAADDQAFAAALIQLVTEPSLQNAIASYQQAHRPPFDWSDIAKVADQAYALAAQRHA